MWRKKDLTDLEDDKWYWHIVDIFDTKLSLLPPMKYYEFFITTGFVSDIGTLLEASTEELLSLTFVVNKQCMRVNGIETTPTRTNNPLEVS